MNAHLSIAGLRLGVEGGGALPEHFHPFRVPPAAHAWPLRVEIRPDLVIPSPQISRIGEMSAVGGGPKLLYERVDLRFVGDADGAHAVFDGSDGGFEAVVQLALQLALRTRGGLLIHGSAGVHGGGAWLMPGPSGTGKSTAARGAGFERVLADEMIVVRRSAGGFRVWGTPFWSPDRPLPLDAGSAPLAVLARLVQADVARATPLSAAEASAWLLSSVVLYETSPGARASVFELACDVAEAARCVRLAFPKEGPWLCKLTARSSTPPTTAPSRSRSTGI